MKARPQARRRYRRYEAATLAGRLENVARPRLDWLPALANTRTIAAGLLLALIGGVLWISLDATFYISRMRVSGSVRTPAQEIADSTGLVGVHIFWANAAEAERTLLHNLPSLKSARITCQLPAVCDIRVEERQPVIAWKYGGAVAWIDADSAVFAARQTEQPLDVVTIEAVQGPALFPGRQADPKVVQAALAVAHLMPEVKVYRYSGAHGLEYTDPRGFPVYLGLGDDMLDRIMVWQALRADLIARNVQPTYVDVQYPLAPYYGTQPADAPSGDGASDRANDNPSAAGEAAATSDAP